MAFTKEALGSKGYIQHWVLCKLGKTSKYQLIAKPGCGSGRTNNFELLFLISSSVFQSAAVVGGRNTNSQPA